MILEEGEKGEEMWVPLDIALNNRPTEYVLMISYT
jgi:hypothetical protein